MGEIFNVRPADWLADGGALRELRHAVFVVEQGVPVALEYDGLDDRAWHMLACTIDGQPVGTGRLLTGGRIGRMAVVAQWRRRGVGHALLRELIACAREQGLAAVDLHAQCSAIAFYEAVGFRAHGPVFDEAGIPHRHMYLELDKGDA